MVNRNLLKAAIAAVGLSQVKVSKELNIDPVSFWRKSTGISSFTQKEICVMRDILLLTDEQIMKIFFAP